jgi:hypothetical protein
MDIDVDSHRPRKQVWYQKKENTTAVLTIHSLDQMVIGIAVGKLNCGGATPAIYRNYATGYIPLI